MQRKARDRRALSFPAECEPCPEEDESNPALAFVRKTKPVNGVSRSFKRRSLQMSPEISRLTMTTGQVTPCTPTTPAVEASTFYSTSDSEDSGSRGQRSPALTSTQLHPAPPMPLTRLTTSSNTSSHRDNVATSLSARLPGRPTLEARNRSNPVARMSSSSSRSREDIISWARGVDARHRTDDSTPVDAATIRRPRGRRPEAFAHLVPPSTEPLDEPVTATTPKNAGPLSSALGMTFGPVMNAFRSVSGGTSSSVADPAQGSIPQASALGLQAVPAPAEVSIVDVVVGTKSDCQSALDPSTPSLSTMSLSDAVDPSTTTDMYDTATDDLSIVSSVSRAPAQASRAPGTHNPLPQQFRRANKAALPLRPTFQSTASAFWNFSTYLRSLTPFAAPATPKPAPADQPPEDTPASESLLLTPESGVQATSPVPTTVGRSESPDFTMQPEQLVRSVPMDIALAPGSKALEVIQERQREREVLEMMPRSRSRTRIQASRSPSVERAVEPIGRKHQHHQHHARQVSYDADCSEVGEDRGRRGRGQRERERDRSRGRNPRGERRSRPATQPVTPAEPAKVAPVVDDEPERGRRRDRGAESRDRSWSAARGRRSRSRTARCY